MRRDELLVYYERELRFIRKLAVGLRTEVPRRSPVACELEPTKCDDPARRAASSKSFAMLTARVHLRLDDDFSEISDALVGILYPHYLKPDPLDDHRAIRRGSGSGGRTRRIQAGVETPSSTPAPAAGGVRCAFRTAYDISTSTRWR